MGKLLFMLTLIGGAYWYWNGPYQQQPQGVSAADQLAQNGALMRRCVGEKTRMSTTGALAGMGGVAMSREDAERECAQHYGLQQRDGEWHDR